MKIQNGLCHCGCGRKTNMIMKNISREDYKKGDYRKFIHNHHPVWCKGKKWEKTKFEIIATPEFSYLLGVRYGDGKMMKWKKTSSFAFGLNAIDKDFVIEFRRCCCFVTGKSTEKMSKVWKSKYTKGKRTDLYGWAILTKRLYNFLNKDISEQMFIIKKYPNDFLRGFWDSEGGLTICEEQRHRSIRASNKKLKLLLLNKKLFENLGFGNIYIYKRFRKYSKYFKNQKDSYIYEIVISNISDIIRFAKEIKFSINRKQKKLENWIEEYFSTHNNKKYKFHKTRKELYKYWKGDFHPHNP
jgi:intein-encoded DNA endonuclease-like protein